jgi:hypothetical protein
VHGHGVEPHARVEQRPAAARDPDPEVLDEHAGSRGDAATRRDVGEPHRDARVRVRPQVVGRAGSGELDGDVAAGDRQRPGELQAHAEPVAGRGGLQPQAAAEVDAGGTGGRDVAQQGAEPSEDRRRVVDDVEQVVGERRVEPAAVRGQQHPLQERPHGRAQHGGVERVGDRVEGQHHAGGDVDDRRERDDRHGGRVGNLWGAVLQRDGTDDRRGAGADLHGEAPRRADTEADLDKHPVGSRAHPRDRPQRRDRRAARPGDVEGGRAECDVEQLEAGRGGCGSRRDALDPGQAGHRHRAGQPLRARVERDGHAADPHPHRAALDRDAARGRRPA